MPSRSKLPLLLMLLLPAPAAGCRPAVVDWTAPETRREYASLPGLEQSGDPQLGDHYRKLLAAGATPEQLAQSAPRFGNPPPEGRSTAELLRELVKEHPTALTDIEAIHARLTFPTEWVVLQQAPGLREEQATLRIAWLAALRSSDHELWIDPRDGLLAEPAALDGFRAGFALEQIRLAELLAAERTIEAHECLERLFAAAHQAAGQPHPLARLTAARSRLEIVPALAWAAVQPSFRGAERRKFAALLAEQLSAWPEESRMWIHERAVGLHTYELVRDGHLLSLLSIEELSELRRREALDELPAAVLANLNEDQRQYLEGMETLIAAAGEPYHRRTSRYEALAAGRSQLVGTQTYPWVAEPLLKLNLDDSARLLARDRMLCEAWEFALAAAEDETAGPVGENPLTGEPYVVSREAGSVVLRGAGEDEIRVPLGQ